MEDKKYDKAFNYALYLLGLKGRTELELKNKLIAKDYDPMVVHRVIETLLEKGLVDDVAYAKFFIESRSTRYGSYRIKQSLKLKGLSDQNIETAFESYHDPNGEFIRAEEILRKKTQGIVLDLERLERDYSYKMKVYGKYARFLVSRGFSSDVVKKVVAAWMQQELVDE